jgi:hypothetical protein
MVALPRPRREGRLPPGPLPRDDSAEAATGGDHGGERAGESYRDAGGGWEWAEDEEFELSGCEGEGARGGWEGGWGYHRREFPEERILFVGAVERIRLDWAELSGMSDATRVTQCNLIGAFDTIAMLQQFSRPDSGVASSVAQRCLEWMNEHRGLRCRSTCLEPYIHGHKQTDKFLCLCRFFSSSYSAEDHSCIPCSIFPLHLLKSSGTPTQLARVN